VTTATLDLPVHSSTWEAQIGALLEELSAVQAELLQVLEQKRDFLAVADIAGLAALQPREIELTRRLEGCQHRRGELLAAASAAGMPGDSIQSLAAAASGARQSQLGEEARRSAKKMRLLAHQGLANWVLAQRSLLHVSQLLEIIATGGRMQPTYGEKDSVHSRGSLVNQEA
jgi:hypothetical protein